MKTKITINVPAMTRIEEKYACSKCGEPCGYDERTRSYYDRIKATIAVNVLTVQPRVEIECEEGKSYPEGANVEQKVVDCCYACFIEHAIPALVAAGFQVRDDELSW